MAIYYSVPGIPTDPELNIAWPNAEIPLLAAKDASGKSLAEAELFA